MMAEIHRISKLSGNGRNIGEGRWLPSPLATGLLVYFVLTLGILLWGFWETGGILVYPLDDTYIHMAVAKNLALHGIWGPSRYESASSSSSPLWTLLLAALFRLLGVQEWIPLILSSGFALLALISIHRLLGRLGLTARNHRAILVIAVLVTPLPALSVLGMEHAAHALLTLWVLWIGTRLGHPESSRISARILIGFGFLAALWVAIRPESCFGVLVLGAWWIWRWHWIAAATLGVAAGIPYLAWTWFVRIHGWNWLPNSVLAKASLPDLTSLHGWIMTCGGNLVDNLFNSVSFSLTLLAAVMVLLVRQAWKRSSRVDWPVSMALILTAMIVLHLQFARMGGLFRYEAYLILTGGVAIVAMVARLSDGKPWSPVWMPRRPSGRFAPRYLAEWSLVLACLAIYAARAGQSAVNAALSMSDRYLEHLLTARFLGEYYQGKTVVLNDIGAAGFYADVRFLDLYGIGSTEPLAYLVSKKEPGLAMTHWIAASEARIAVLQTEGVWIAKAVPRDWIHVADWRIPRNVQYGDRVVGFYARDDTEAALLAQRIRDWIPRLPPSIVISLKS